MVPSPGTLSPARTAGSTPQRAAMGGRREPSWPQCTRPPRCVRAPSVSPCPRSLLSLLACHPSACLPPSPQVPRRSPSPRAFHRSCPTSQAPGLTFPSSHRTACSAAVAATCLWPAVPASETPACPARPAAFGRPKRPADPSSPAPGFPPGRRYPRRERLVVACPAPSSCSCRPPSPRSPIKGVARASQVGSSASRPRLLIWVGNSTTDQLDRT